MDNQPLPQDAPTSDQQPIVPDPAQPQVQPQLGMFERRTGRLAFLLGVIYSLTPLITPALLQLVLRAAIPSSNGNTTSPNALSAIVNVMSLLVGFAGVILFIPVFVSSYVRRLHDINQSGLLTLLLFVPILGQILILYLLFAPGTQGTNKYGNPINTLNFWVVTGLKKPIQ